MRYRSRLRLVLEGVEGVAVFAGVTATWPISKRWFTNWGSTPEERERQWPGDRFVSPDHGACTRAIIIDAPSEAVWPWLAQFGLGRAGFYSYELLERMVGIPVTNVEGIVPALQSLKVGDEVRLHPTAPGIPVGDVQPGRYVCYGEPSERIPQPRGQSQIGHGRCTLSQARPIPADWCSVAASSHSGTQRGQAVGCHTRDADRFRHGAAHAENHQAACRKHRSWWSSPVRILGARELKPTRNRRGGDTSRNSFRYI